MILTVKQHKLLGYTHTTFWQFRFAITLLAIYVLNVMRFGAIDKLLILLAEFCRTALLTFGIFTISQKNTAQD